MRLLSTIKQKTSGFTLVEILIIAPVVILVISGFIALIITMVGDVLAIRDRSNMAYEIRDTLDRIEQDSRLSTQFLVTTGTLPSPQGSDSNFTGTAAFTNADSLIMGTLTTNKNPSDSTRQLIFYAKQPNDCGALETYNRPFIGKVIYFLKSGSLWRRTYLFNYNTNATPDDQTVCTTPWQLNSCSPGYSLATRCQTNDSEVMKNVSSFSVKYYSDPSSTTEIGAANALNATTIEVTINGQKTVVGRNITNAGSLRASRLNSIDADLTTPAAPTVTAQSTNANGVKFSWPTVPSATSYLISYNINGGSWVNTTNDSLTLDYTVNANRKDTVTIQVAARNPAGTSSYTTVAFVIPDFNTCSLQNNWVNFGPGAWSSFGFTKTSADVVHLKGMIKNGNVAQGTIICTLPVGFRPTQNLVFQVANSSANNTTRIDVYANGNILLGDASTNSGWVSLDSIRYLSSTATYTQTNLTPLQNSWANYDASGVTWPILSAKKDTYNRVFVQGLIKDGAMTPDGVVIVALPAGYQPQYYYHIPVRSNAPFNLMGVSTTNLQYKNINTAGANLFYSPISMFYASGAGTWSNLTLSSGWVWQGTATYPTAQYTKSTDGIVTLRGLIKNGTTNANDVIANLPAGYRPKERLVMIIASNGAAGRIDIGANGDLLVAGLSNVWAALDSISFMAEQ